MKTKKQKIQEIKQLASDPDEPILTAEEIEFLMHHGVTIDQILEQPLILRERTVYEAKILEGLGKKFPQLHVINLVHNKHTPSETRKFSEKFYLREP